MDLMDKWEKKLQNLGMPAEPLSEQEKAARADIELISTDMMDPDAEEIAKKLKEEDIRNVLGGFPNSMGIIISLIKSLKSEAGTKENRLYIHSSCINDNDCVTISHSDGKIYHYNTKNIRDYSREKMISLLEDYKINYTEK